MVPDAIIHVGPGLEKAPLWWHADLCEDIECSRSNEDRKVTILTEETHETPGKILVGATRPTPTERATFEPIVSNITLGQGSGGTS